MTSGAVSGNVNDVAIFEKIETTRGPREILDALLLRERGARRIGARACRGERIKTSKGFLLHGRERLGVRRHGQSGIVVGVLRDLLELAAGNRRHANLRARKTGGRALVEA